MKKTIGITGAGGRIGSVLSSHLIDEYKLRLFTFKTKEFAEESLKRVAKHPNCQAIEELDLSDEEGVKGKFKDLDVVIHLAANPSPSASYEALLKSNFDSTINVFEECIRSNVKRIIFASTNHTQHALVAKSPQHMSEHKSDTLEPLKLTDVPYPDSLYHSPPLFSSLPSSLPLSSPPLSSPLFHTTCFERGLYMEYQSCSESISENFMHGNMVSNVYACELDHLEISKKRIQHNTSAHHQPNIYLSHRDCVGYHRAAINCTINTENNIPFLVVYACSNNTHRIWDMTETFKALDFVPLDDSEMYFTKYSDKSSNI